jgi:hypothetical protein
MGYVDMTQTEIEEEIILSPSGYFTSEQFYSPPFFRFKILSSKFQTCFRHGPNTRDGRVPGPRTTVKEQNTKYFYKPIDKTLLMTKITQALIRIMS